MTHPKSDQIALQEARKLIFDCSQQYDGGHGGTAVGMAAIGLALWKYTMRYSPENPNWLNRDRFIMSNGHAGLLQYVMMYLFGYPSMTMKDLKGYTDPDPIVGGKFTNCHGHPEIETDGVEIGTGPLGQGMANAVGMAIAAKNMAAKYSKPGFDLITSRVYCTLGDACIQEGVGQEALQLAGHFKLDNLVFIFDNNEVTCDGPAEWIASEDINAKMKSMGFNVIDVIDGNNSVEEIVGALTQSASCVGKPTFINVRTTIGYGTSLSGTKWAHHGKFPEEDIAKFALDGNAESHTVSHATMEYCREASKHGKQLEEQWNSLLEQYAQKFPKEFSELQTQLNGGYNYQEFLQNLKVPKDLLATNQSNGYVFDQLLQSMPNMIAEGADLWDASALGDHSNLIYDDKNQSGRCVRIGIREFAMCAVANGIACFQPGAYVPVTATFLIFYLYSAPAVRMGSLNELQTIHIATRDSVGEGFNGPTHQPVEVDSLYRAMPNTFYIRPSDAEEVVGSWMVSLAKKESTSIISVARGDSKPVSGTCRNKVQHGGYVIQETKDAEVTLIGTGSELMFAESAAQLLNSKGIKTRLVSMPCLRLFEKQSQEYQNSVLGATKHAISVEAFVPLVWARYCDASIGMDGWGFSANGEANFRRYGFSGESIASRIVKYIDDVKSGKNNSRWTLLK